MSGTCLWNPVTRPDKSSKDLTAVEIGADRTCPVQEPDMFDKGYWNPAPDPDESGGLRKLEGPRHVWAGGLDMSDFTFWNPARKLDMSKFSGEFSSKKFFDDLHITNSLNASPLIVWSSYDTNKIKAP
jgi:hypothetical protein